MKNIMLIGATGMIGSRIAAEAIDRKHAVTAVTRSGGAGRVAAEATATARIAELATGHDTIISAISPPRDGTDPVEPLLAASRSVIEAARTAGVGRVIFVGGAGSLLLPDGTRVVDQGWFPEEVRPEALAHAELLQVIQNEATDLQWTSISPAGLIEPGERTGVFELGKDDLIADGEGNSRISAEDFAVATIDELENGANIGRRMTLGYV